MSNVTAMKNGTLLHPDAREEILRRIEPLAPESERRWGRMTAHQMVARALTDDASDLRVVAELLRRAYVCP